MRHVIKIGSDSCGSCGRMAHYDSKVANELGYNFVYLKKGSDKYNNATKIREEVKAFLKRGLGFPTYAVYEDETLVNAFMGGMPKNKFRDKLREGEDEGVQGYVCSYTCTHWDDDGGSFEEWGESWWANVGGCRFEGSDANNGSVPGKHFCAVNGKTYEFEGTNENAGCSDQVFQVPTPCDDRDDVVDCAGCHKIKIKSVSGGNPDPDPDPGPTPPPEPPAPPAPPEEPTDPCIGVECPPALKCVNGKCVDRCPDICTSWDGTRCVPHVQPPVDPIDPCPTASCDVGIIGMQFNATSGLYGMTYDQSRIRSVTPVGIGDKDGKAFIVEFKPGACDPEKIADSFCVVDNTTASGNHIISVDDISTEQLSEYVFKVTVKGSYYLNCNDLLTNQTVASPVVTTRAVREGCSGFCAGGDSFDVQKPDASCTNWIKFTSRSTGKEFEYESKATGVYNMNFEAANEIFDISFRSTCDDFDDNSDTKIKDGGKTLVLEDHDDADYTDLIITATEGIFAGRWQGTGGDLTYTSGKATEDDCGEGCECINGLCGGDGLPPDPCEGVVCPPGQTCINGECFDACGNVCPEGTECVDGRCQYTSVSGNFFPAAIRYECCPDCKDKPQGGGDTDGNLLGCDTRPDTDPVPGTDTAADVYLYDRLNHTFKFCCPIQADVTWLLPFDALPPVFQRYITTAASVRAAAQMVDNPQLFQLLKDRENILRMECNNYELEQGDLNYLNQPDHSGYVSYNVIQTLDR